MSNAEPRAQIETRFTLSPEGEIELYNVRDTQLFLSKACEAAGDEAGAGTFRLLADATTRVIEGLTEEMREVA